MEAQTATWIVVIAVAAAFGTLVDWAKRTMMSSRIMRCPATGSITFVRVAPVANARRGEAGVAVTSCDLWPARRNCGQGCLARYAESRPGPRVDLNSLRPFGRQ